MGIWSERNRWESSEVRMRRGKRGGFLHRALTRNFAPDRPEAAWAHPKPRSFQHWSVFCLSSAEEVPGMRRTGTPGNSAPAPLRRGVSEKVFLGMSRQVLVLLDRVVQRGSSEFVPDISEQFVVVLEAIALDASRKRYSGSLSLMNPKPLQTGQGGLPGCPGCASTSVVSSGST